jgi:SOS response regulatory protein OraA/RecX
MDIKITTAKEDSKLINIIIDDRVWKKLRKSLFINHLNDIRECLSLNELEEKFEAIEQKIAKHKAIALLAARSYFSCDLKRKLESLGLSPKTVTLVLKDCKHLGYLNDDEKSKMLVVKLINKGYGPHFIAGHLKAHGCSESTSNVLLKDSKKNQKKAIYTYLKRNYVETELCSMQKRAKAFNALVRRGFDTEEIRTVLLDF